MQFAPGSVGHSEFFHGRQGGVCTEEEALDLGLRGDQALGVEGSIQAKAWRSGVTLFN